MGALRNLLERVQEMDRARENIDDDRTTNRHLRSLRRHDRVQKEEMEIERLKKKIKAFEQNRGDILIKIRRGQNENIKRKIAEKKTIIRDRQFMIPRKRPKRSMLSKGFL